ncbi:hypothetical protein SDC9_183817 [bioreactor metagenome]|uniref:Uncharacterized protein n=1 Tax=bioreactor metagenome TaxID=1076179 RepID=A0A645HBA0_9ZZZZ
MSAQAVSLREEIGKFKLDGQEEDVQNAFEPSELPLEKYSDDDFSDFEKY